MALVRCGDSGGRTAEGDPCRKTVLEEGDRCRHHPRAHGVKHSRTCGEFGGVDQKGNPCGMRVTDKRCHHHRDRVGPEDEPLLPQEQRFVEEYIKDLDAKRAALAAGYSETVANSKAYQWVSSAKTRPRIFKAVRQALEARSRRTQVEADDVLRELVRIGFLDLGRVVVWGEDSVRFIPSEDLSEDDRRAVRAVKSKLTRHTREDGTEEERLELELKTHDKLQALREIGKHLGLAEKVEVSGSLEVEVSGLSDEELINRLGERADRLQALKAFSKN